jgi:pimeloyl-ACP methyl ester carboxylesterase
MHIGKLGPFGDLLSREKTMFLNVNGINLNVEVVGSGKPLIFFHGNGEDHHIFDPLVDRLKHYFTCYLVDSRGHGKSEKVDHFHYDDMAEDIYEMIMQLELEKPMFIGFSDGGIIGLIIGMKYPELISRMMVLGANIHTRGIQKKVRKAWEDVYLKTSDPMFKLMIEEPNFNFYELHKIKSEVMVVVGEFDVILPRHTKAIAKHIKDSRLVIIKEKHHEDYIVYRDDLYDLCMEFFKKP